MLPVFTAKGSTSTSVIKNKLPQPTDYEAIMNLTGQDKWPASVTEANFNAELCPTNMANNNQVPNDTNTKILLINDELQMNVSNTNILSAHSASTSSRTNTEKIEEQTPTSKDGFCVAVCTNNSNNDKKLQVKRENEETPISITVETMMGLVFDVTLLPSDRVISLKRKLEEFQGIDVDDQVLIFNSLEMTNDQTMRDCAVYDGATLRLIVRMRGGPINYLPEDRLRQIRASRTPEMTLLFSPGDDNGNRQTSPINLYVLVDGNLINVFELTASDSFLEADEPLTESELEKFAEIEKKKDEENKVTRQKMIVLQGKMKEANLRKQELKKSLMKPAMPGQHNNKDVESMNMQTVTANNTSANDSTKFENTEKNVSSAKGDRRPKDANNAPKKQKDFFAKKLPLQDDSMVDFFINPGNSHLKFQRKNLTSQVNFSKQESSLTSLRTTTLNLNVTQPSPLLHSKPDPLYSRISRGNLLVYKNNSSDILAVESTPIQLPSYVSRMENRMENRMEKTQLSHLKEHEESSFIKTSKLKLKRTNESSDKSQIITKSFDRGINMPLGLKTSNMMPTPPKPPLAGPVVTKPPWVRDAELQKCQRCSKRIGISTSYSCRCGMVFCMAHRLPEQHGCTFDFKGEGKKELKKNNPKVVKDKVQDI